MLNSIKSSGIDDCHFIVKAVEELFLRTEKEPSEIGSTILFQTKDRNRCNLQGARTVGRCCKPNRE
jgi:hypothetical protein